MPRPAAPHLDLPDRASPRRTESSRDEPHRTLPRYERREWELNPQGREARPASNGVQSPICLSLQILASTCRCLILPSHAWTRPDQPHLAQPRPDPHRPRLSHVTPRQDHTNSLHAEGMGVEPIKACASAAFKAGYHTTWQTFQKVRFTKCIGALHQTFLNQILLAGRTVHVKPIVRIFCRFLADVTC